MKKTLLVVLFLLFAGRMEAQTPPGAYGPSVGAGSGSSTSAPSTTVFLSPNCPIANINGCFFAYADAQVAWNSTTTNGSGVVTNVTYSPFVPGDVGKTCYATNASIAGGPLTATDITMAEGTITAYTSASSVTCSGLGNTKAGVGQPFIWGHLDTANIAAAWTAAQTACATLQLPGGSMLNESGQFNTSSAFCYTGVGNNRKGEGVMGVSASSTTIINTPNFNFATCTGKTNACFGGVQDGMTAHDFTIWGSGLSYCITCILNAGPSGKQGWTANYQNGGLHDLRLLQWGGAFNTWYGFYLNCAFCTAHSMDVDGFGYIPCRIDGNGSLGNPTRLSDSFCGDGGSESIYVYSGGIDSSVETNQLYIGGTGAGASVVATGTNSGGLGGGGTWFSNNDRITSYITSAAQLIFAQQNILVEMGNDSITQTGAGIAIQATGSSAFNINNSKITTASGTTFSIDATSAIHDACGNSSVGSTTLATITAGGIFTNCGAEPSLGGRCLLTSAAGPLACVNASNGRVAVPATTATYTINTTAPQAASIITISPTTDNSGIPGSPVCGAEVLGDGARSATVAGVSFTFAQTSAAVIKCYDWSIR